MIFEAQKTDLSTLELFKKNPKLEYYEIPYTDKEEWLAFRNIGVGGSEAATVIGGIDPDNTAAEIFEAKLGIADEKPMNEFMFHGKMLEDYVAHIWQYYDGTPGSYVKNFLAGKQIRERIKIDAYVRNMDYPWLFASVDGLIPPGSRSLLDGMPLNNYGVYEGKCMSYFSMKQYDSGFPEKYVVQAQVYMLILELEYAEFGILQDGNKLHVKPLKRDDRLIKQIIEKTKRFWFERVVPAREELRKRNEADRGGLFERARKAQFAIDNLCPPPDGTEAYEKYMSKKFFKKNDEMKAPSMDIYHIGMNVKFSQAILKKVEEEVQFWKNKLIQHHLRNQVEYITFGKFGKSRYYKRDKGKNFQLDVQGLKERPNDDAVMHEFGKMNFNNYEL